MCVFSSWLARITCISLCIFILHFSLPSHSHSFICHNYLNCQNNPPSPNAGPALSKERKLTVTLFTVNVVSVLTILPFVIWIVIAHHIQSKLCHAVFLRIEFSFVLLYLFNSIINPLIYAIRMQEFRKAATKLFCTKTLELAPVQPLTLHVRTQAIPVEERT